VAESTSRDPLRQEHPAQAAEPRAITLAPSRPSLRPSVLPGDPAHDLAGALHEVSNALTVVLGWIERARDARAVGGDVERALDVAADRASLARSIVRRAIGAEALAEPPAAVATVVADAVVGLEPELQRAGIQAVLEVADAVAERAVDHAPTVLQILTNLLLNAIAMSPSGSVVRVEAFPAAGDGVLLAVADEGPGVPPERRATLFEAGLTTRAGGAGIGLRHAAALARSLGGVLALGDAVAGARFELTWPLASVTLSISSAEHPALAALTGAARSGGSSSPSDRPARSSVAPPPEPSSLRRSMPLAGTRILLVEDDDAVVDLLDTALTARGADVVSIRHHRELAGALATGPFDAALFDISPIQDDVRGAVASARGASEALRVVLISGSTAELPALPDEWVSAWVRKPFEVGEILQAIIAPAMPSDAEGGRG
jgi:CheY-like chemotaxis protein